MHRRLASLRPFSLGWALVLLAAACSSGPATWTFQPTPEATAQASGSPTASGSAAASGSPTVSGSPSASGGTTACAADDTVIKIEETAALQMVPATVDASAGKKVCFEITNTAGFTHNFYVGPASDVQTRNRTAAVAGTPDFSSGTQTLEYTFTGSGPFEYACWIPGHLEAGMKGSVTLK